MINEYFKPGNERKALFPVEFQDLFEFYKSLEATWWLAADIPYASDLDSWETLNKDEQHFIKNVLAFFAESDAIISDNLIANMSEAVPYREAKFFYNKQAANEDIHNETYSMLLDKLVSDPKEKEMLLSAIDNIPAVGKKAQWAEQWVTKGDIIDKLIAFTIVEGLLFSGSFCAIYYMNSRQKLPALSEANRYISQDECFIKGTEVLTPKGWKLMHEVSVGDEVIGYKEGIAQVEKVQRVIEKEYEGDMISFKHARHKCIVTPNHDMIINKKHDKKFYKVKAKDLKFNTGKAVLQTVDFNMPGKSNLTARDRLKIALQADGSNSKWTSEINGVKCRGKDGGHTHTMSLTKQRKQNRIEDLLNTAGIEFSKKERRAGKCVYTFHFEYEYDCKCLDWIFDLDLNKETCKDIIDECSRWDGSIISENSLLYCSTDKACVDVVQAVAVLAGYGTQVSRIVDNRKATYKDHFKLHINVNPREWSNSLAYSSDKIEYNGTVHCLTVPSGGLITRYEDRTFIAGNCLHTDFAIHLYKNYVLESKKKSNKYIAEMIEQALQTEREFILDSLPVSLIGMNSDLMNQYLQYVANDLYQRITEDPKPIYNDSNPFDFMENIAMRPKTNFFEKRVTEYQAARIGDIEETDDF